MNINNPCIKCIGYRDFYDSKEDCAYDDPCPNYIANRATAKTAWYIVDWLKDKWIDVGWQLEDPQSGIRTPNPYLVIITNNLEELLYSQGIERDEYK